MKKIIILFIVFFSAFSITIVNAQKKNTVETTLESQINTSSPVFEFVYEKFDENGKELGTVVLQIYDRLHQFVGMNYDIMRDRARDNHPKNPLIKLIQMPEIHPLAFRQAESLAELDLPVDNTTVIEVRQQKLEAAARIKYPN